MFGHVRTDTEARGLYYLFYTYNSISGGAVLAALVAGDAAVAFEVQPEQECVDEVMQLLRGIFEPQGVPVPEPLQVSHLFTPFYMCGGGVPLAVHLLVGDCEVLVLSAVHNVRSSVCLHVLQLC